MSKLKKFFIDLIKKTKNKFRNIDKKKLLLTLFNLFLKLLVIMFITLIIYIYSQFFCNGKFVFEKERMVLNFILIIIIIEFFYMLTGKLKLSLYISMILTFIIGIINHFVTAFRGTPLVPWDVFSVNVALTVLPTFKFTFTKKAIFGILTFIIGLISGLMGIGFTLLLNIPINIIIKHITDVSNITKLPFMGASILVLISMGLTVIAGLIPSKLASKKDPVEALRTE